MIAFALADGIFAFLYFNLNPARIWKGKSPFVADKTHIHHLFTNQGFSHGFILMEVYWLRNMRQEWILVILVVFMLLATVMLKNLGVLFRKEERRAVVESE